MPRLFRVYTLVHTHFSVYAIKIIKNIYIIPYFRAGLMVTPVVQPPQHVANCFQLIETTLREYKSPSCAWPKGERNYRYYTLLEPQFKSDFPCLLHFPDFYRKPLFPGDAHQFICHLMCTSLESILVRQGRDGSRRRSVQRSWKDSGDLSTFILLYMLFIMKKNHLVSQFTC